MALNLNSLVVGGEKTLEKPKEVAVPRPVTSVGEMRQVFNIQPNPLAAIKEPSVVVNGKVKKISKKSAFLLDMLSLDD
jgi:hypothetical protein